ncbi:MAG: hypothetical protein AAF039_05435 [Bacteroidota bacterium]
MNTLKLFRNYRLMTFLLAFLLIASCSDDDDGMDVDPDNVDNMDGMDDMDDMDDDDAPPEENEVEVITDVTVVFTNTEDPDDVVEATAQDPDGEGVMELTVDGPINLTTGVTYTLTFDIFNNLEDPGEDIGEEILEEDDEHQIFFQFTEGAFTDPMGDGNIGADNAADPINYLDEDSDGQDGTGNPVGLVTEWTAGDALTDGTFRVNLQHQPGVKTATSTSEDGDTDFDLTFVLNIEMEDEDGAPPEENEVEVITDVTVIFTNTADDTDVVTATATDPDGQGVLEIEVDGPINLTSGVTYTLTFDIFNNLESPGEDIGQEILEEDDEHQIFFAFTDGAFTSPMGDGNIGAGNAADPLNYMDEDDNGDPVGLVTEWTAGNALMDGTFRVNLQHQPGVKTSTSTSEDGDTDFDLTFVLNIQ